MKKSKSTPKTVSEVASASAVAQGGALDGVTVSVLRDNVAYAMKLVMPLIDKVNHGAKYGLKGIQFSTSQVVYIYANAANQITLASSDRASAIQVTLGCKMTGEPGWSVKVLGEYVADLFKLMDGTGEGLAELSFDQAGDMVVMCGKSRTTLRAMTAVPFALAQYEPKAFVTADGGEVAGAIDSGAQFYGDESRELNAVHLAVDGNGGTVASTDGLLAARSQFAVKRVSKAKSALAPFAISLDAEVMSALGRLIDVENPCAFHKSDNGFAIVSGSVIVRVAACDVTLPLDALNAVFASKAVAVAEVERDAFVLAIRTAGVVVRGAEYLGVNIAAKGDTLTVSTTSEDVGDITTSIPTKMIQGEGFAVWLNPKLARTMLNACSDGTLRLSFAAHNKPFNIRDSANASWCGVVMPLKNPEVTTMRMSPMSTATPE